MCKKRYKNLEKCDGIGIHGIGYFEASKMGLKSLVCGLLFALVTVSRPGLASPVALELIEWPQAHACESCMTVQFGVLEMQLPSSMIDRILIVGNESHYINLLLKGLDQANADALFMTSMRTRYVGKYHAIGLAAAATMSGPEFFDSLGQAARLHEPLSTIRRIEGIETAKRYTKASKGPVHAYWIEAAPGVDQRVHILVDGNDMVYSLVGAMTPQLYRSMLANLRIVPEP